MKCWRISPRLSWLRTRLDVTFHWPVPGAGQVYASQPQLRSRMKNRRSCFLECALAVLLGIIPRLEVKAQTPPLNGVWVYTLVNGSQLTEDCPLCDHVTAPVPMRGTFQLRFLGQGPFFANYTVENISFTAGQTGGRSY